MACDIAIARKVSTGAETVFLPVRIVLLHLHRVMWPAIYARSRPHVLTRVRHTRLRSATEQRVSMLWLLVEWTHP